MVKTIKLHTTKQKRYVAALEEISGMKTDVYIMIRQTKIENTSKMYITGPAWRKSQKEENIVEKDTLRETDSMYVERCRKCHSHRKQAWAGAPHEESFSSVSLQSCAAPASRT